MGQIPNLKDRSISASVTHWATKANALRFTIILVVGGILITGVAAIYTLNRAQPRPTQLTQSPPPTPAIKSVSALGRLEPTGEAIEVGAPGSMEGARVQAILVSKGDWVRPKEVIAVLDSSQRLERELEVAQKQVKIAQANLEKVKAGAKPGAIDAQKAKIARLGVELQGEKDAQQTNINSLEIQILETGKAQDAKIQAQEEEIKSKEAAITSQKATIESQENTVNRLKAEFDNATEDFNSYQQLAVDGVISELDLRSRSLKVETALESYKEAQADLQIVQANLSQVEANLSQAKANLSEIEANKTQTISTLKEKLTEAKVNLRKTEATFAEQIKQEQATLAELQEVRPVDVQQGQAEVERALAEVRQAETRLKSLGYIYAEVAGQILDIKKRPGETVEQGKPVIVMGQTDQMIAIAEVYESDISQVRIGQEVTIKSEGKAFAGQLKGTVKEIGLQIGKKDSLSTDPAADVDSRVVEVKIRLGLEDSKKVAGLTNSKVIVEILL